MKNFFFKTLFPITNLAIIYDVDPNQAPSGNKPTDGIQTDANKTSADDSANDKKDDSPKTITLTQAEYDTLHGKTGAATAELAKLRKEKEDRLAAEKKDAEAADLKKGEYQKVIDEKAKEIERLSSYETRLKAELVSQWESALKEIPKDDDRFKGIFKTDEELTLQDLGDNLNKFRQFKQVGAFSVKSNNENAVTDDGNLVVIKPDAVPQQNQAQGKSTTINPWT